MTKRHRDEKRRTLTRLQREHVMWKRANPIEAQAKLLAILDAREKRTALRAERREIQAAKLAIKREVRAAQKALLELQRPTGHKDMAPKPERRNLWKTIKAVFDSRQFTRQKQIA